MCSWDVPICLQHHQGTCSRTLLEMRDHVVYCPSIVERCLVMYGSRLVSLESVNSKVCLNKVNVVNSDDISIRDIPDER